MIERPTSRYGQQRLSRRARRRLAVVLTVAIVAAAVTLALVAYQRLGTSEVKGELGGYELVDTDTVRVTISVTRGDPSRPVVCIIRARSVDGAEVGRRELLVPPSTADTVQVTALVEATRQPVVGDVYGCGTDVPSYLVAP
ncbi:membrane protein [Mycobacterium antarcticum]|uniref:DUF4307 domain-containing protein n=1 Tax=unclassified Mycolicibacterium TaxID=2636767 RepID=UPI0023A5882C|nr:MULTISPECIES: DUF4307 domain-containing protein [unclassified Mycolicibacterium]BDX30679.1 membrane protein [Mycolicibacterium sp. TUM20985]GLP74042.1 membrane protein [Mycolicibacterium sp. TUM20983]GLP79827.1 membrane protein [Mycolicibacterium sp. TUM20984]